MNGNEEVHGSAIVGGTKVTFPQKKTLPDETKGVPATNGLKDVKISV